MDKSIFPSGHVVHSKDLVFDSAAIRENVLRRFVDGSTMGIAFGLTVARNGINTARVDVLVDPTAGKGWGYTPNGEMVEILTDQTNLALADYTDGVINYVCAVYTEIQSEPSTHETDEVARNTRASRSFRIVVMTPTELAALPTSSPDLDVDAQDRIMVLGVALGNGFTGPTPNALVPGEITQQAPFERILTATGPNPPLITGVEVIEVNPGCPIGTSRLAHQVLVNHFMRWRAPGDSYPASSTLITGDGEYTLFSNNAVDFIKIRVVFSLLPSGTTIEDDYTISAIYENPAPRYTAADLWHRSLIGSSIPTENNPHGLSPRDFGSTVIDFPQLIRLGAGFLSTEVYALLARLTANISTVAGVERTLMLEFPGGSAGVVRVYATQTSALEITVNAFYNGTVWGKDINGFSSFKWVFDNGFTEYRNNQATGTWADTAWDDRILEIKGVTRLGLDLLSTTNDLLFPRLNVPRSPTGFGFNRTHLLSCNVVAGTDTPIEMYLAGATTTGAHPALEVAVNATWDGFNNWTKADPGSTAAKLSISLRGVRLLVNLADTTWTDTIGAGGWTQDLARFDTGGSNGVTGNWAVSSGLSVEGTSALKNKVTAGANIVNSGIGDNTIARYGANIPINSAGAGERWLVRETINTTNGRGHREYVFSDATTYRTEFAVGCYWDGSVWKVDDATAGSVHVTRVGPGGTVKFVRTTYPGAGWADNAWQYTDTAFGVIQTDGAGNASLTGANFNVTNVIVSSQYELSVVFSTPLFNSIYPANLTAADGDATGVFFRKYNAYNFTNLGFHILGYIETVGGPTNNRIDFTLASGITTISFTAKDFI